MTRIGSRQMHVDHLHRGELLKHRDKPFDNTYLVVSARTLLTVPPGSNSTRDGRLDDESDRRTARSTAYCL